jgi:hypothetical protein
MIASGISRIAKLLIVISTQSEFISKIDWSAGYVDKYIRTIDHTQWIPFHPPGGLGVVVPEGGEVEAGVGFVMVAGESYGGGYSGHGVGAAVGGVGHGREERLGL